MELPRRISRLGQVLGALYLVLVLSTSLPPRLLSPEWQMQVVAACIDSAAIPLLGLTLIHLASYLDPDDARLHHRSQRLGRLAVGLALGFLLLVPLQAGAGWRQWQRNQAATAAQRQALAGRLAALRSAVAGAGSSAALERQLQRLEAPPLSPADLALPFPELKQRLQRAFQLDDTRLQLATGIPRDGGNGALLRSSLRLMLSALLVSLGFAALAQAPNGGRLPLWGWLARLAQGPATSRHGSGRIVDGDDFLEISGNDPAHASASSPAPPSDNHD